MRALYLKDIVLTKGQYLDILDEKHHHIKNVLRLKVNDEILIIQGFGQSALAKIESINKKNTKLVVIQINGLQEQPKFKINLYIGLVKKDALESSLRSAVELGANKITFLITENSQRYEFNTKRVQTIIENSIEQSNLLYIPSIEVKDLVQIDLKLLKNVVIASNRIDSAPPKQFSEEVNLFIGPESGFSPEEEKDLIAGSAKIIRLDSGILRTRTAIPALIGFVLGNREKIDA